MNNRIYLAGAALALSLPVQAGAAEAPGAPALAPLAPIVAAPAVEAQVLVAPAAPAAPRAVTLRTLTELSSKTAKAGDAVTFEVTEDVVVDGAVLIPAGSKAYGEVTFARHRRGWGKPGRIEARVRDVQVGETRVALDGQIESIGESRKKQAIRAALLIAPFWGFWVHGRETELPNETIAYLPSEAAVTLAAARIERPVVVASAEPAVPAAAVTAVTAVTALTVAQAPALPAGFGFVSPSASEIAEPVATGAGAGLFH